MADRILTWHIIDPTTPLPSYYIERDYIPDAVRIYATSSPGGGDFEVDIRDDGTTIFVNRTPTLVARQEDVSRVGYNTLAVSTFQVGEYITGASAEALVLKDDGSGNLECRMASAAGFTDGETITGGTSLATAVVISSYYGAIHRVPSTGAARTTAELHEGDNLEEHAENYPEPLGEIAEGSIVTCHVMEMASAQDVTVQLELVDSL